ncbi:hypothetical protein BKI52_44030 [marine bacterium AO1-C]|nr:hypothetical protein BKI52_44030 [marine bacterium AO1-C]
MDILKTSTEWAKDEVFSSTFFIFFGIMFVSATIGFWQLGKTDLAKAFVFPTLVAGVLLLVLGVGLFFLNKPRITNFATTYKRDAPAFVKSEIVRTKKSMAEYQTAVFKVIPLIIIIAALLIVFIDKPIWRAISITTIALMAVVLLVDTQAHARLEAYHKQLVVAEKNLKN